MGGVVGFVGAPVADKPKELMDGLPAFEDGDEAGIDVACQSGGGATGYADADGVACNGCNGCDRAGQPALGLGEKERGGESGNDGKVGEVHGCGIAVEPPTGSTRVAQVMADAEVLQLVVAALARGEWLCYDCGCRWGQHDGCLSMGEEADKKVVFARSKLQVVAVALTVEEQALAKGYHVDDSTPRNG